MKIDIDVPDGKSGDWSIESFTVSQKDEELGRMRALFSFSNRGRYVPAGTYKALKRNNEIIMSNTPDEISDCLDFIRKARKSKNILINGLGLGVVLKAILDNEIVENVTVIEKSFDVITLVAPSFANKKVTIIHADAFNWKPPKGIKYDCVWHDIWDYICADNLEDMKKLHRKYGKRTIWQASWCRYECERKIDRRNNFKFQPFFSIIRKRGKIIWPYIKES